MTLWTVTVPRAHVLSDNLPQEDKKKTMKRKIETVLLTLAISFGIGATAVAVTGVLVPDDSHCVHVEELDVYVCGTTTTQPDPTTTTTVPETTTTTEQETTTTTVAPTTTTTVASGGDLVIPATQEQTVPGFKDNESFSWMLACIDVLADNRDGADPVTCDLNQDGNKGLTSFDYLAHGMPYLHPDGEPGMHNHAWWVAGDREGYRCVYGFMYNQHPNPFGMFAEDRDGHFIAQAVAFRPAGYGKINDKYMDEGVRYFDGSPANEGGAEISEDCLASAQGLFDFDYDAYVPHGPDDIRVGLFHADGNIADIRDFTKLTVHNIQGTNTPVGHFEFIGIKDGLVRLGFVYHQTQKVSHVIYYQVKNDGQIAVEVNGVTHQDN